VQHVDHGVLDLESARQLLLDLGALRERELVVVAVPSRAAEAVPAALVVFLAGRRARGRGAGRLGLELGDGVVALAHHHQALARAQGQIAQEGGVADGRAANAAANAANAAGAGPRL